MIQVERLLDYAADAGAGHSPDFVELAGVRYRVGSADLRTVQQQQMDLVSARAALLRAVFEGMPGDNPCRSTDGASQHE